MEAPDLSSANPAPGFWLVVANEIAEARPGVDGVDNSRPLSGPVSGIPARVFACTMCVSPGPHTVAGWLGEEARVVCHRCGELWVPDFGPAVDRAERRRDLLKQAAAAAYDSGTSFAMPLEAGPEALQLELRTRLWEPTAADIECADWLQAELGSAFRTGSTGPEPIARSMYFSSRRELWRPTRSPEFSRLLAGVVAVLSDEVLIARPTAESTLDALASLVQEVAVCPLPPPVPVSRWKRVAAAGLSRWRRNPKAGDR